MTRHMELAGNAYAVLGLIKPGRPLAVAMAGRARVLLRERIECRPIIGAQSYTKGEIASPFRDYRPPRAAGPG